MRARGPGGELRVGYQRAARLGAWEIVLESRLPRTFTFRSMIFDEHDYWITQRPLDLVLSLGMTEWVWRDVAPARNGRAISMALTERPIVSDRAPMMEGAQSK